jgi:hypothetical protein
MIIQVDLYLFSKFYRMVSALYYEHQALLQLIIHLLQHGISPQSAPAGAQLSVFTDP